MPNVYYGTRERCRTPMCSRYVYNKHSSSYRVLLNGYEDITDRYQYIKVIFGNMGFNASSNRTITNAVIAALKKQKNDQTNRNLFCKRCTKLQSIKK